MISLFALGLIFAGELILIGALFPVRRLIKRLPSGPVRRYWYVMVALIAMFILGYLGYVATFWESHWTLVDLIVPVVFFSGACFVFLAATLSLRTVMDVLQISLLERDAVTDSLTSIFNRRYRVIVKSGV